jgi:cation diffusion facilitator CzcD-associated flavoprotein CzcO
MSSESLQIKTKSIGNFRIAVIGAGFAGIGMGIQLKKAGYSNFTIYEKSQNLGGTWRDNTYPGCACDVASHLYSFSFEKNPYWPNVFSKSKDILHYLTHCVEKYGISSHIKLGKEVSELKYNQESLEWTLKTSSKEKEIFDIVINGTGPLNKPFIPTIDGIEKFKGEIFHSSKWKHNCNLEGQAVACIGTGASAIQFIPAIVDKVKNLNVFQRTPTWLVPRFDRSYSTITKKCFAYIPGLNSIYRTFLYWRNEYYGLAILGYPGFNSMLQKASLFFLRLKVKDPALRKKLTPQYKIGCKRINISDAYYDALQKPNSDLITSPINSITENGIVTADGIEHRCDTIIFGTGFKTQEFLQPMHIYGCNDVDLTQSWRDKAKSFMGISVSGFPNFFLLLGPNTGLGHNSVIFMIESQIKFIMTTLQFMYSKDVQAVDVKEEHQENFYLKSQKKLKRLSWGSGCNSWYLSKSGENFTIWPGFSFSYWCKTIKFPVEKYIQHAFKKSN